MRIALCSHEVAGLRGGGIGTYVREAVRALGDLGHEVWLLTSGRGVDADALGRLRAEPGLHRLVLVDEAATSVRFGLARAPLRFAQLAFDALQGAGCAFDYVEFPDYEGWGAIAVQEQRLFQSLGDAVVTVVLHSPTHECWQYNESLHVLSPSQREQQVLEDEAIRTAQAVWTPSTRLGEMVSQRLGLPAGFADIIRYPMALPEALPSSLPKVRDQLADLDLLYFGRIEPRKGVRQLVDAFARLPELSIECVGRDGDTSPLQTSEVEYLRQKGAGNVTFTAPLPRERMLERVRAADVVLLPSPWENWPNTCIEAMAAGRVVIGGKNGGMAEMIEHGKSGFLVDGSDPDDIVRVLREDVAAALPQLPEIGRAAARRIRELSDPKRYVAAIEAFVARRRRAVAPAVVRHDALVSVVVPFYREEPDVIGQAVDSVIGQSHPELEILIVDDGSPRADRQQILDGLAARDARVRVLHRSNGGLARARNHALEHVRGQFVLFCDADNVLRPEYAATGLTVFARCPEAMAVLPRLQKFVDGTGERLEVVQPLPYDRPLALFRNSLGDAGAMLRREVFTEHGVRFDSDVDVYSDWALWLDLAQRGLRREIVPRVLYDYRVRSGSLMDEHAFRRHLPMLGVLIQKHLPDTSPAEREMLLTLVQGWGVGAIASALGGRAEAWERPDKLARRLRPGLTRFVAADVLGKLIERVPPLHAGAHWLLSRLVRLHGRWKDRQSP